jgi:hypothetical protein
LTSRTVKLLTVTGLILGIAGAGYVVAREPGSPTAVKAAVDQYVPNLPEPGGGGGAGGGKGRVDAAVPVGGSGVATLPGAVPTNLLVGPEACLNPIPDLEDLPDPKRGDIVNVGRGCGRVTVRVFVPRKNIYEVNDARRVPVGSIVDARRGVALMEAELSDTDDIDDDTRLVFLFDGVFKVFQDTDGDGTVELRLHGPDRGCDGESIPGFVNSADERFRERHHATHAGSGRSLWAKSEGGFLTRGREASATSDEGATWLVHDRCNGPTEVRVTDGDVDARDFAEDRTLTLSAGDSHVAGR